MRLFSLLLFLVSLVASSAYAWHASIDFDTHANEPWTSAAPGYLFCTAATSVLTPSANATAWCLSAANYDYSPYVMHGSLSNVRMHLPTAPTVPMSTPATLSTLSQALADVGFSGNATQVTDYQRDIGINIGLTVGTFVLAGFAVFAMS